MFRDCLETYHEFGANPWAAPTQLYAVNRAGGFLNQVRIAQEYRADFERVGREALPEKLRSVFGAMLSAMDYHDIGRLARVPGRSAFHLVYRVQYLVGCAAAAAQLWPTWRYFGRGPFMRDRTGPVLPRLRAGRRRA